MRKTPKHIYTRAVRRNMSPRTVLYNDPAKLAMINAGVVMAEDMHNNIGRTCDVPDGGQRPKAWRVVAAAKAAEKPGAVTNYVVRRGDTSEHRVVDLKDMGNLS